MVARLLATQNSRAALNRAPRPPSGCVASGGFSSGDCLHNGIRYRVGAGLSTNIFTTINAPNSAPRRFRTTQPRRIWRIESCEKLASVAVAALMFPPPPPPLTGVRLVAASRPSPSARDSPTTPLRRAQVASSRARLRSRAPQNAPQRQLTHKPARPNHAKTPPRNRNTPLCYTSIMPNPRQHSTNAERQAAYRARRAERAATPKAPIAARSYNAAALAKMQREIAAQIAALLEAREQYQSDRSETWLDSDARETFDEKTADIEESLNLLSA